MNEKKELFELNFNDPNSNDSTHLKIKFHDKKLYNIFKQYMDTVIVQGCRLNEKQTLSQYAAEFKDNQEVVINPCFGNDNIIGKFFLETDLDWPEKFYEEEYNIRKYKQPTMAFPKDDDYGKGVPLILLGRQGKADIPDNIMKMLNSYKPYQEEIKKFVPHILQDQRTSKGKGFFARMTQDQLHAVAHALEPGLTLTEAGKKLFDEMEKAKGSYLDIHKKYFSLKNSISFTQVTGTHVHIDPSDTLKEFFVNQPLRKPGFFANGCQIFKTNKDTIAINKGPGSPGIQIQDKGGYYLICNNLTADDIEAENVNELQIQRNENLQSGLFDLKVILSEASVKAENKVQAETRNNNVPTEAGAEKKEEENTCSIQ